MTNDTPNHLREIKLAGHVLERWREAATYLATVNAALVAEVDALGWGCTPLSLTRCAMAARYIAVSEAEPYAGAARALTTEFEEMAKG